MESYNINIQTDAGVKLRSLLSLGSRNYNYLTGLLLNKVPIVPVMLVRYATR